MAFEITVYIDYFIIKGLNGLSLDMIDRTRTVFFLLLLLFRQILPHNISKCNLKPVVLLDPLTGNISILHVDKTGYLRHMRCHKCVETCPLCKETLLPQVNDYGTYLIGNNQ